VLGVGEVVLDQLQMVIWFRGELQLLLETGRQETSFAQRPVILKRGLVISRFGEGEGMVLVFLRQQRGWPAP